jgi:hypothetical protein
MPTTVWAGRKKRYNWSAVSTFAQAQPDYMIRDRDASFGQAVTKRLAAMGIRDHPTAPRSPWQNGHAERLIYIRKRGRGRWTMADHSHSIRARQEATPINAKSGTFASIVKRSEVAFLYDRGCVPPYTVAMIEFDEPPWDRFLDKPWGRFICPGCGQTHDMHVSHGPGTPGTERFNEVAQARPWP